MNLLLAYGQSAILFGTESSGKSFFIENKTKKIIEQKQASVIQIVIDKKFTLSKFQQALEQSLIKLSPVCLTGSKKN